MDGPNGNCDDNSAVVDECGKPRGVCTADEVVDVVVDGNGVSNISAAAANFCGVDTGVMTTGVSLTASFAIRIASIAACVASASATERKGLDGVVVSGVIVTFVADMDVVVFVTVVFAGVFVVFAGVFVADAGLDVAVDLAGVLFVVVFVIVAVAREGSGS